MRKDLTDLLTEAIKLHPTNPAEAIRLLANAITVGQYNPIHEARRLLWREMTVQSGFKAAYVDNVAAAIMDFENTLKDPGINTAPLSIGLRQALAEMIVERVFKEE